MNQKTFKLIQISDMHLFADPNKTLLGVPTQQSFQAVLDLIQHREEKIDALILSGDLSQDHSAESYQRLAAMTESLHVPVYCIPGNHDDPQLMANIYPEKNVSNDKHILHDKWQIILLNSHKPQSPAGFLSAEQLNFLQDKLQSYPQHDALIVLHHPPMLVESPWIDRLRLINAEAFWEVIASSSKVKMILTGHVHQDFSCIVNGVPCYSAPSSCFQFKPQQVEFELDFIPPGYRWIQLHEDGRVETKVERVANYVGEFEEEPTSY